MQVFEEKNVKAEIVKLFLIAGFQISSDGLAYLTKKDNPIQEAKNAIKRLQQMKSPPLVITCDFFLSDKEKNVYDIQKSRIIREISVLFNFSNSHITDTSEITSIYHKYFLDRYKKLKNILMQRMDANDIINIEELANNNIQQNKKRECKVIGMITELKEIRGKKSLVIEDTTGAIRVYIPTTDYKLNVLFSELIPDLVILVKGKNYGKYLYATDIYLPDIPSDKKLNKTKEDISVVFISDLHIGNKKFLSHNFKMFIDWLNGKYGEPKHKQIAETIEYVIIAGDLVDGIGIYPNQEEDLILDDIYQQYNLFSEYISSIERDVKIVIIPGNHDAVRQAIPQPPIPSEFVGELHKDKRIKMLSNPALISIEGVDILISHGRGLEDIAPLLPNCSLANPDNAMKLLLKARHLAPVWGGKTQIAPIDDDVLVIDRPPDILHMGHLHVTRVLTYKNTVIVNSGTFQAQTEYQRRMGFEPTPAQIPVINLKNYKTSIIKFT